MNLKLKARNSSDGRKLNGLLDNRLWLRRNVLQDGRCWYVNGQIARITKPPGSSTPIAYTGDKAQVKAVIVNHKAGAKKSDS